MRVCVVVFFFGERLISYHRVCTHLFNQTVEREDDHRLLAELLAGLARVVQKVGNAIHRINHYPVDSVVCLVNIYPLDSALFGG